MVKNGAARIGASKGVLIVQGEKAAREHPTSEDDHGKDENGKELKRKREEPTNQKRGASEY